MFHFKSSTLYVSTFVLLFFVLVFYSDYYDLRCLKMFLIGLIIVTGECGVEIFFLKIFPLILFKELESGEIHNLVLLQCKLRGNVDKTLV